MARKSRVPRQAASITGTNTPSLPQYKVAIYGRISSMKTELDASFMDMQLQILNEFIANHPDMELHDTYFDDGFSGTHFRRPHFTRMIDDMIAGKFNCIVVRDFSRLGRNYIDTSYYLYEVFPRYHIRFISILDNYDSLCSDPDAMIYSARNIINDYYVKDISKKICSALDSKAENGYLMGNPAYGYRQQKDSFAFRIAELDDKLEKLQKQEASLRDGLIPSEVQALGESAKQFHDASHLTREMATTFVHRILAYDDHIEIEWDFQDVWEQFEQLRLSDNAGVDAVDGGAEI